ncbi:hypothetical protein [Acidovorax sp. CCYZU-2555]|uniref:hypothetical protein n=1 Tax=Acidovorax sp. CCYZU-2555 TaxID=2835042 RepID=UPI001BD19852|nr:hypothetical protein [Acidovorax sp. CCYZU-2555]MBS7776798.1 hypothetical protein [Acidovorax sp. CCYZU-2555]
MKLSMTCLSLVAAVLASGCALPPNEREMNSLGSALTKLSAAVDATARYKRSADTLDEDQLLRTSTAHDPGLLKPFEQQKIQILRAERDTAVLVCDAKTAQPLLEDAGCTPQLDAHRWRDSAQGSCEFSLDLKKICSR